MIIVELVIKFIVGLFGMSFLIWVLSITVYPLVLGLGRRVFPIGDTAAQLWFGFMALLAGFIAIVATFILGDWLVYILLESFS